MHIIQIVLLQITPAAGIIKPGKFEEISVHHEEFEEPAEGIPHNWWSEDNRDKEVILSLVIQGSCSTEVRTHQIRVRHCFTGKTARTESKSSGISKKGQGGGSTHRTERRQLNSSSKGNIDDHQNHHNH